MRASLLLLLLLLGGCARSRAAWEERLGTGEPFERGLAALALARVDPAGCGEALSHLMELSESRDDGSRAAARRALVAVAPHHAGTLLRALLQADDSAKDRRSALHDALVAAGSASVEPLRLALYSSRVSPRQLTGILADIGAPAIGPLCEDLRHADANRRLLAAWTLAQMGERAAPAAPALVEALLHDELLVARRAAHALAAAAPHADETRAALERALARPEPELAGPARTALARVALARAEPDGARRLLALGVEALLPAVEGCASTDPRARRIAELALQASFARLAFGVRPAGMQTDRSRESIVRDLWELREVDFANAGVLILELAGTGSEALPEIPQLVRAKSNRDPGVALCARLALLHIVRCALLEHLRGLR